MSSNYGLPDPSRVNLNTASQRDVFCYMLATQNTYDGDLPARISSVFVILIVSSAVTFFPVMCMRIPRLRIPLYVYLFARYFGAGVIIATGFVHLLDPSYYEIGSLTCVGLAPGWNQYSWPPALAMASGFATFLLDFAAERYVEKRYGISFLDSHGPSLGQSSTAEGVDILSSRRRVSRASIHSATDVEAAGNEVQEPAPGPNAKGRRDQEDSVNVLDADQSQSELEKARDEDLGFKQQISAFLVLEFGVIFHSVIIGLTLGAAGSEFPVLYVVIIFHQSFEGLGIGARLSAIPFPPRFRWWPWALCAAYGLTTPISIAIGLGVRTTFNPGSNSANIVAGVLDALSGGILIYTGWVMLLARDFLFNRDRTSNDKQLAFMIVATCLGAGIMALLGKWI